MLHKLTFCSYTCLSLVIYVITNIMRLRISVVVIVSLQQNILYKRDNVQKFYNYFWQPLILSRGTSYRGKFHINYSCDWCCTPETLPIMPALCSLAQCILMPNMLQIMSA